MKKLMFRCLSVFIISIFLLSCAIFPACAKESKPHIIYANYDGSRLYGLADVPPGEYYARVTMFLEYNMYIHVYCPIDSCGEFSLYISAPCQYIFAVATDDELTPFPSAVWSARESK